MTIVVQSTDNRFHREPGEGPWGVMCGLPAKGPTVTQVSGQERVHPPPSRPAGMIHTPQQVCLEELL